MSADDEQDRLLHDLRAPGSDAELSEEERYRSMFRVAHAPTANATRRHPRAPRRLLAGGAAAAVLAVGTGGVAAAYTGSLPSPIQTLAHHVIGAPDASPPAPSSESRVPGVTTPPSQSGPTADPSGSPSAPTTPRRSHRPHPAVPSSGVAPSATASPAARASAAAPAPAPGSPTPSASPPPAGTPAPVLTGVMVVGASHRVDVGARVSFAGRLTYAGTPTSRRRVVLQERAGARWMAVAQGRADSDGNVTLTAPPLQRTSSFRLLAGHGRGAVRSVPWRVAMHPLVTADVSASKEEATIRVTAMGGSEGDNVTLVTRREGRLLVVSQARLDASGSASFVVTPDQRRTRYALVLDPTRLHTSARVGVVVRSPRRAGAASASGRTTP